MPTTKIDGSGVTFPDASVQATKVKCTLSSYVGDDSDNRQIATGFACKLVVLTYPGAQTWICLNTSYSTKLIDTGPIIDTDATDLVLHATDGFIVDKLDANGSGVTYYYFAIG